METPWRDHPLLRDRFHPSFADDLQVIVHQGGPRVSMAKPELIWVRLEAEVGAAIGAVYRGRLLNAPHQLPELARGAAILVLPAAGSRYPLRTTERYLDERALYEVEPCDRCGLAELFDAPSTLIARIFPSVPAGTTLRQFSTFCPLCGGVQIVRAKGGAGVAAPEPDLERTGVVKRWWELLQVGADGQSLGWMDRGPGDEPR